MQCTCTFSSQQQAQEETGSASAQQLRHDGHGCLRVPPSLQPHDHQTNRLELFLLLLTNKELSLSCCCCLSDEEFKQARISGPAAPPYCCMHLMIRLLTCCWYLRSLLRPRDLFLIWNCWSLSWHPSERDHQELHDQEFCSYVCGWTFSFCETGSFPSWGTKGFVKTKIIYLSIYPED